MTPGSKIHALKLGAPTAGISFAPDGDTFAAASGTGLAIARQSRDCQRGPWLQFPNTARVLSVDFGPDNTTVAAGLDGGSIAVWDVNTRTLGQTLSGHSSGVCCVKFSPLVVHTLASADEGKTMRIWCVANNGTWESVQELSAAGTRCAFSPFGRLIFACEARESCVCLWSVDQQNGK